MRLTKLSRTVFAVAAALALLAVIVDPAVAQTADEPIDEDGPAGPIEGGATSDAAVDRATEVTGEADAHLNGVWTDPVAWPISAIHAIVLGDGTVMTYGTDENGRNSKAFTYDIWDPARGADPDSHTTLPVNTSANLFCSAQTVLPWNGQVLLTGGEEFGFPGGTENDAIDAVNLFDPSTRTVSRLADSMAAERWYPTVTTLATGEVLVHGGRVDKPPARAVLTPEVYHPRNGWRRLTNAKSSELYGQGRWWYPRSWLAPNGKVFVVSKGNRAMWYIDPKGKGSYTSAGTHSGQPIDDSTPAAMFDIGKVLITGGAGDARVIDLNGGTPKVTKTSSLGTYRSWSDATVLPDGTVVVTGGASRRQQLDHATRSAQLWNPETGKWHRGAAAAKARLYHSSAVLLPDATVLTSGGGPPGPVVNMNAEIYYPPNLFRKDGSGRLATRPKISGHSTVDYGSSFSVDVTGPRPIEQVVLVRSGSTTHSFDMDQRRIPLSFQQQGDQLTVQGPANSRVAPPGQYMLFLVDEGGVPSRASILRLNNVAPPPTAAVQTGELTIAHEALSGRWIRAAFKRPFARTPVVVVGGASNNWSEPVHSRVRNVTKTGFEIKLEEWDYQNPRHALETLSYVAAEPGSHTLGGITIEAGATTVGEARRRRRFPNRFDRKPVVLAQVASDNDSAAVEARVSNVYAGVFSMRLQQQESHVRSGRTHGAETVHHIAFSKGRGKLHGQPVRVGGTREKVTHQWSTVWFGGSYADGAFLGAPQTYNGSDTVAARYRRLWNRRVDVRVQEEKSFDSETRHGAEVLGWVLIGGK